MRILLRNGRFSLFATGRLVITFLFGYLLSIRYYQYASSQDPSSYFFDPKHAYEKKYSALRIEQAKTIIEAANIGAIIQTLSFAPKLCIGIATVARTGDQTVHLTVGSLLAGLPAFERSDIHIDVLLAHTDPSQHPMASAPWLEVLADRVLHYDPAGQDWTKIKAWEHGGWHRNKTIYDYTHLLESCYDTEAKYVAILEDDTLAVDGWYSRLGVALSHLETTMKSRAPAQRWLYLRLFYTDGLLGWNSEEWPIYLFWSTLFWYCVTAASLVLKFRYRRSVDPNLTDRRVVGLSTVGCVLVIFLHFLAGRNTTHPVPRGTCDMEKYGCCTQGLLYPRAIIPDLLAHINLTTDWQVETMIEKIADQQGWSRWATTPPLIQHVGVTSSKDNDIDTKKPWSFRFENWDISVPYDGSRSVFNWADPSETDDSLDQTFKS